MKFLAALLFIALLGGCAAPAPYSPPVQAAIAPSPDYIAAKAETVRLRTYISERWALLDAVKSVEEREALKKKIAELEAELVVADNRVLELNSASNPSIPSASGSSGYVPSGSGTVHTGPRGGRYTITPSGKKSYIRRK